MNNILVHIIRNDCTLSLGAQLSAALVEFSAQSAELILRTDALRAARALRVSRWRRHGGCFICLLFFLKSSRQSFNLLITFLGERK